MLIAIEISVHFFSDFENLTKRLPINNFNKLGFNQLKILKSYYVCYISMRYPLHSMAKFRSFAKFSIAENSIYWESC